MLIKLEKRKEPSQTMLYATPVIAVLLTMVIGGLLFTIIGHNGFEAVWEIFITPVINPSIWPDLGVKAGPLILIAVGLSIGFKANVWNIGAEGQYIIGALAGTGIALATWEFEGWWILPLMCIAGALGGGLYAAVPAYLKTKLNVNEILTSLMLTYAAVQLLNYLMRGPWKDPEGFNFPETRQFNDSQILPEIGGTIIHMGVPLVFLIAIIAWFVMSKSVFGFQIRVVGSAPSAARYGGFSANKTIWAAMLIGGAFAGLAGIFEASGPFQQMVPQFPTGYGFTAIIVAFLGRLHPIGIIFGGIILAVSYVGGEIAQSRLGLPNSAAGIFQALMLFFLLASDILIKYRMKFSSSSAKGEAA